MKPGDAQPELPKGAGEATVARLDKLRLSDGPHSTFAIRRNMQRTMQVGGCYSSLIFSTSNPSVFGPWVATRARSGSGAQ